MSIRGEIVVECDRKTCHGEIVLSSDDATVHVTRFGDLSVELLANGWRFNHDTDRVECPQCCEERERDEDDGRTYADPRDERDERRHS